MNGSDQTSDAGGEVTLDPPDPAQRFGAAAAADAELADRVADETDDDADAESRFATQSRGPVPTETAAPRDDE